MQLKIAILAGRRLPVRSIPSAGCADACSGARASPPGVRQSGCGEGGDRPRHRARRQFRLPRRGQSLCGDAARQSGQGRLCELPGCSSLRRAGDGGPPGGAQGRALRLRVAPAEQRGQAQAPNGGPANANGVAKSGWLAPGVAYVEFTGFPGSETTLAEVRKFLAAHKDAKTLIIDARNNGGGGLAEMNLVFEQIFAKPTTLVTMDIRQAVEEKHGTPFDPQRPADAQSE